MLQRQHVVCRMINGCLIVARNARPVSRRVPKADVALGAAVKEGFVADLLVDPYEPGIFVDGRLPANR